MVEFFLIAWLILSALLGLWNQKRGNGFLTGFLISLLLSPLIGLLMVIITKPKKIKKK